MTHENCGIMKFLPIFFISQFSLIQDIDTDFEACRIVKKIYTWFWKNTTRNLLLSISAFLVKLIYNQKK